MTTEVSVELVTMTCGECGCIYGMSRTLYNQCKNHGQKFYCTNGHCRVFKEPQVERLTRLLAEKDQELAAAKEQTAAAERRVTAQKARVTRLKNKAAKGECPCCGKLFKDLHEHMQQEHPDFEAAEEKDDGQ